MIIDVTGFGWSGSGAVHDLLREYDDVIFASYDYDWEFTLLWEPDGIYDLEHKLCQKHCRTVDSSTAIQRFLRLTEAQARTPFLHYDSLFCGRYYAACKQYVDDLVQFSFEGSTFEDIMFPSKKEKLLKSYSTIVKKILGNHIIVNVFHKDLSRPFIKQKTHTISVSYNPDNFYTRTYQLLNELFSYVRKGVNKPLVTDQLFPPDCPNLFFKFINEPIKCIVVRRDPRDTYLLAKRAYHSQIPLPVKNVEDFILFYKKTIAETAITDNSSILSLSFEDLVYDYEETKKIIEGFLGIANHTRKFSFFKPEISINNTQLFKLYKEYSNEIHKIEQSLPDSLYPFEKYGPMNIAHKNVF